MTSRKTPIGYKYGFLGGVSKLEKLEIDRDIL